MDSLQTAEQNRAMFKYIAKHYDVTNRILSLGLDQYWRSKSVKLLSPKPGESFLDVGCGTGDSSIKLIERCPEASVIGIDPSPYMLDVARNKLSSRNLESKIQFILGDMLALQFASNTFDGVVTCFCIRNVTDRKKGLSEVYRVLKPRGRFFVVELTEPEGFLMRPLFRFYSKTVMPLATSLLSSVSAYKYLAESMADFPAPTIFCKTLESEGFSDIRYQYLTSGIVTVYSGVKKSPLGHGGPGMPA